MHRLFQQDSLPWDEIRTAPPTRMPGRAGAFSTTNNDDQRFAGVIHATDDDAGAGCCLRPGRTFAPAGYPEQARLRLATHWAGGMQLSLLRRRPPMYLTQ